MFCLVLTQEKTRVNFLEKKTRLNFLPKKRRFFFQYLNCFRVELGNQISEKNKQKKGTTTTTTTTILCPHFVRKMLFQLSFFKQNSNKGCFKTVHSLEDISSIITNHPGRQKTVPSLCSLIGGVPSSRRISAICLPALQVPPSSTFPKENSSSLLLRSSLTLGANKSNA